MPRLLAMMTLSVAVIAAGMLAGTAYLGGQIRHSELRLGAGCLVALAR